MACCALMMPEEVQNISACSDLLTENNQNSFLHSTLEQFFTAKTRTLKIDKTDAVAVIELQRYLTEQQNVGQHPPDSYSYDMIVTDGVWQAKCILDCSLNHLIHKNIIRSGIDINITQCSFVFNERRLGQGCVCIEKIEHGSKESNVLRKIKDLDSLPMISKDGFGNIVALQSDSPLQVGRKHYLSLWNNEDPEGRLWVPDVPPSEVVLDVSKMTLLCDLESSLGCMFRPLPLLVRVIHKSRLRYYGKPDLNIYYPYQAYFEVADQSGTMSLVLWNELCPEWYQRLNVGTVLYLQNYTLKQSYQNRSRPHIDNHRMKSFHSVEICLNPRNPTAVLTVVPAKSVPPQWGLPEVSYQFAIRSELDSMASNSACDVIGLVTFVSRVERIKSKGNTGPEKYWTYRWVHAVDGTSNIPFILEIFASSQPEIFNGLYPMTYLVCTQMRKCQEQDSLPYLTSSCETQIFTTGYHKGQPYVSDPRVKSFIQWTKTLKDSVMLKKTAVGGHYCYPHAPIIFTQSVADGSAQVPLVAANDLKSEMEGLHYREHKRLAIQGQIMAVYYVTLPEETLSDQQMVQSVVAESDPPSDQRMVEVTQTLINRETAPSSVQSSPSRRKRKQAKRVMKRCYITRARMQEKREAGHGLTEEERDSETEEVSSLEKRTDQTRASEQLGPPDIPQSEGATGERAVADCDRTSWESSSWPKQRQEVLEYLHPGGVYSESLSQRFRFDDKTLLLQQSNLHAARWTPEQTTDTLSPVTCKGYYKITILGINQQMAIDAAFVPVMSSGDPRSVGLTQDPHDNTLLSCLSAGFICPLADPLSQSEVALPEPEEILATAEELKDTHLVCILDLCHLVTGTGDMVAIMISHRRGMEIVELLRQGIPVSMTIEVVKQHGVWMSHYSVFFVSISFFMITAVTVCYFIFYSARRLNVVRLQNLQQKQLKAEAKKAIGQLQVRTVKRGDKETGPDADTCAVCIDAYKSGDVLTILTCNHFFHKTCIEPWLMEHRTCPMCKCDILKALGVEQPEEDQPSHQLTMHPDMTSYPRVLVPEDTRSETASAGYASVQCTEEHSSPADETHVYETLGHHPGPGSIQVDIFQPHYDNLAFEGNSRNQREPLT